MNKKPSPQFWLIGLPLIILLLAGAYIAGQYTGTTQETGYPVVDNTLNDNDTEEEVQVVQEPIQNYTTVTTEETLDIEWIDLAKQQADREPAFALSQAVWAGFVIERDTYPVNGFTLGVVKTGSYAGWDLAQYVFTLPGMGDYYETYYVLENGDGSGEFVLLNNYHQAWETPMDGLLHGRNPAYVDGLVFELGVQIPELDIQIHSRLKTQGGVELYLSSVGNRVGFNNDAFNSSFAYNDREFAYAGENGEVIGKIKKDPETEYPSRFAQKFFVLQKDGRPRWYDIVHPFWDIIYDQETEGVPEIVWSNGKTNKATYTIGEIGGCGYRAVPHVVDESQLGLVVEVGTHKTDKTVRVFAPETYESEQFQSMFTEWNQFKEEGQKGSFDEFIATHPVFYWKDGFGRWIQFKRTDLLPAAECGKPVIYLYPEQETRMRVEVAPKGGFTFTEPEYGSGWEVSAKPDGQLQNIADGNTYPYLFWEGRGGLYSEPTNYWVVAQKDVHTFLVDTLAALGLNEKETADFLEFWEPRMQSAPYYKIGFHGTRIMNELAPLTISQKPDMLLRILMDYSELEKPIKENPPTLPPTPKRHGFSVIEWGGVIQ